MNSFSDDIFLETIDRRVLQHVTMRNHNKKKVLNGQRSITTEEGAEASLYLN